MSELRKMVTVTENGKVVDKGLEFVKDEEKLTRSIQSLGEKAGRNLTVKVTPLASWGGPTTGAGQ